MTRLGDWHFFVDDRLPQPVFIRHEELLRMDTIGKVLDFTEKLVTPCVSSRTDDVLNNRAHKLLLAMEITDYITQVKHKDARDAREGLSRSFSDTSAAQTATCSSEPPEVI